MGFWDIFRKKNKDEEDEEEDKLDWYRKSRRAVC